LTGQTATKITTNTCGGEVTVRLPISNRDEISQASQGGCAILECAWFVAVLRAL